MTDKDYAVPLHELLANVPKSARLVITDPDGKGTRFIPVGRYCHEASEALRAALAQPEPEPVAWCIVENGRVHGLVKSKPAVMNAEKWQPLYTAPPQREWQGLTDEEIDSALNVYDSFGGRLDARKIETKLKEKNG